MTKHDESRIGIPQSNLGRPSLQSSTSQRPETVLLCATTGRWPRDGAQQWAEQAGLLFTQSNLLWVVRSHAYWVRRLQRAAQNIPWYLTPDQRAVVHQAKHFRRVMHHASRVVREEVIGRVQRWAQTRQDRSNRRRDNGPSRCDSLWWVLYRFYCLWDGWVKPWPPCFEIFSQNHHSERKLCLKYKE